VEDGGQLAQEQLAELQLLARADLHSPAASFTPQARDAAVTSLTIDDEHKTELNDGASRGRPRVGTGGLSSFTAILAASRKLAAATGEDSAQGTLSHEVPVAPLDQTRGSLTVEIPGRRLSPKAAGKSLPTLSEGAEGEEDDEDIPEPVPATSTRTLAERLSSSSGAEAPGTQEQDLEEADWDDPAFVEMLDHLSRGKLDSFALTAADLSPRKLESVHTALRRHQPALPSMPYVRALVAVDMVRLLLRRLGARAVCEAVERAIRQLSERDEDSDPVALLTSSNIAAVVLEVRRELSTSERSSVSAAPLPRRTSPVTGSANHQVRRASLTSPRSTGSPSSSLHSSPRSGTPRSPAPDRRSILAKDGVHVLMQEKLAAFDHRGQTHALPAFRVNGASASTTESATKRRQRGLQYATDHTAHRTVHM
jgi:hypothetical protein